MNPGNILGAGSLEQVGATSRIHISISHDPSVGILGAAQRRHKRRIFLLS
jgi:hypothetical protein